MMFAYQALDTEMRRQILTQRLQQIEVEHYNQATNRDLILGGPEDESQQSAVAVVENTIAELERAHNMLSEKIAALGAEG